MRPESEEPPEQAKYPTPAEQKPQDTAAPAESRTPAKDKDDLKTGADADFPIVGIGASAGGLEALERLTRRLSHDGMAFVIIQHLSPGHESMLRDILARGTSMEVITARDGLEVKRNIIYVTPPNSEISIQGRVLHLKEAPGRVPRHTIDHFLRTLASDIGPMSIGVVLSGAGTDGTLGLRALKEEGGITFVQEPGTASQSSMPQSALDAGVADFCLSPAEIGDELMRLSAHPYVARKRQPRQFSQEILKRLFELLRSAFGVDFSGYKLATIERRIERRMALQKLEKVEDYVRFIESNADELGVLYSDLLIGVTGFFRDREPFDALKTIVFPRLLENRSIDLPIRIWVPGCATGEEAYSIAISLLEFLDEYPAGHRVQIFGTDIDDQALARARQAHYPQNIELDVSADRLQRFFSRYDSGYQVSRQVRDMVVFARHNLGKDPPFSRLDLISCRNVLIYMQPPLQRKVLRVFHYALNPEGFLMLSMSESVGDASDMFLLLDRKLKIYAKKSVPSNVVFDAGFGARVEEREPQAGARTPQVADRRPPVSVQQLADRRVLERYGPPGILVDQNLEVIQFRGQTGPFLAPLPGSATLNVMRLVRPEFLRELRSTLKTAMDEGVTCTSRPVPLHDAEGGEATIEVMPLKESKGQRNCYLVLFRVTAPAAPMDDSRPHEPAPGQEPRVEELERELLVTREYLETSVQDLEAANEELQSANEELQSSNEELQSTNEELETSKEELQSTNEELATVNEELQNRMAQLSVSNDDLQNLMEFVSLAVVIVGLDLRIRRFSKRAEQLLNLIPGDVGRPIAYLGSTLNSPQIESVISESINTVRERAQRVRCSDSQWYSMRVIPYRTADHAIRGTLLEFMRAPAMRKIGDPPELHEFVGRLLATLPHLLLLLDQNLRIVWANRAFLDFFGLGTDISGRSLNDVWAGRSTHPQLWQALEQTALEGKSFPGMQVEEAFGQETDRPMKFSARYLPPEADRPAYTLVEMEETSGEAQP